MEPSGDVILGNVAIKDNAFRKKVRITSVSGGATSIGVESFRDCSNIASIMLPNITGQVGAYSIRDCSNLEVADLGSCTQINNQAFQNDHKFQTLILRRTSLCVLQNSAAFTNTPMVGYNGLSGTIYVPSDLISSYKSASNWSSIFNEGHVTFTAIEGSIYEL